MIYDEENGFDNRFLQSNNYHMKFIVSGDKLDVHYWPYDMNTYYKWKYGELPPLNKKGW